MTLQEIINIPTVFDNIHESVFRSYHSLEYVLKMIERGDSKESILEVARLLRNHVDTGQELTIKKAAR